MRGSRHVERVRDGALQSSWCTCAILMNVFTERRTARCWRPTVGICRKNDIINFYLMHQNYNLLASVSKTTSYIYLGLIGGGEAGK